MIDQCARGIPPRTEAVRPPGGVRKDRIKPLIVATRGPQRQSDNTISSGIE